MKCGRLLSHACRLALAIFVAALVSTPALAQANTVEITITVHDPSSALLPQAVVVVTQDSTGRTIQRTTGVSGQAYFPALPPGIYTISVQAQGFESWVRTGLHLLLGEQRSLDVALKVGSVTQKVSVAASPPALNVTSPEISDTIENRRILDLPLNGRQFLQLALLSEGVVIPPGGTRGAALEQAGPLVNILGQRNGHNLYFLDGVSVTDEYFNNLAVTPSVDSIQEFEIEKAMYPPEYGGKSGALINVETKSGASTFHGGLYDFLRNSALDAKNFFDSPTAPIPPFRQNQFGGTLGGPLALRPGPGGQPPKTFFFLSYEGLRSDQSITQTFSVPTPAERMGNFSADPVIYDPLTTTSSGTRSAFPGNIIPPARLDNLALQFLAKLPLPNLPGEVQNLVTALPQSTNMNQGTLRLDHQINNRDNLFFRFIDYDVAQFQPFGSSALNETLLPGFGRNLSTQTANLAAGFTHIFNPDLLNEIRFGWMQVSGGQTSQNQGVNFAAQSGLQGVTSDPRDVGYPQISFSSLFSTAGDPTDFVSRNDSDIEIFDTVTLHHNHHNLKFGAYFFHLEFNPQDPQAARGSFVFSNRWTSSQPGLTDGNAFADFLLGFPTSAQGGTGRGQEDGTTNWLHFFIQDEWNATPTLTLSAGIRYELDGNIQDSQNRLSAINLAAQQFVIASDSSGNISPTAAPLLPFLPLPYVTSSSLGWAPSLLRPIYHRIGPRLGLAWRPLGSENTVIRAGFGIFQNQAAYSVQQALARNLPFFLLKSINTTATTPIPTLTTEQILASNALGTVGGNNVNYDYRTEYNQQWTLSIQHELPGRVLLETTYLGSRTVGADNSTVLNVPVPGPGIIQTRRPVPQLSNFNTIRWDGWSDFNGLTVKAERRFSRGIWFDANYTWSKLLDDASDPGATVSEYNLPQNVRNLSAEKGLSSFNHTHRFVASFLYDIPFPSSALVPLRRLFADWQAGGIATVQSGAPFTVNLATDQANIGPGPAQRPDLISNPNDFPQRGPNQWFNTASFTLPALYTFGNAGRNIVTGPGLADADLSLQRDFPIRETQHLIFRAEFFNALNHPNFDTPNRIAFTPNFGRIFSAEPSRQIQFALKYNF